MYANGKKSPKNKLTKNEFEKIKEYQSSPGWKEIQKQRQYVNRDVYKISSNAIEQILARAK